MSKLELFFDNNSNNITTAIYNEYESYDYEDQNLFELDVNFLAEHIYKVKITEARPVRIGQSEFRKAVILHYNNKCIVTGTDCIDEIEAAHIMPFSDGGIYSVMNGLPLKSSIHKTFDKYLWSINPNTLCIEIKMNKNVGEIKQYKGKKIFEKINDELKKNLSYHYNNFITHSNNLKTN